MINDLRFAFRSLRNTPCFTLAAVTMLALGIGANTAIFSIVYGVLLKPLPFEDPARVVSVVTLSREQNAPVPFSGAVFDEWRASARALESVSVYRDAKYTVTGHGEPEYVHATAVSDDFFKVFATSPAAGRVIGPADTEQAVTVITWELSERRFSTGGAIGKTLLLDGRPYTVIGVMPPAFRFPSVETMMWIPRFSVTGERAAAKYSWYQMVARLKSDNQIEQARVEAASIGRRVEAVRGSKEKSDTQLRYVSDEMVGGVRKGLLVLFAVVAVVLLVACINVGGLCLARVAARGGDAAVRAALGASRWRLVRHALAENVVLAACGAIAGVLLAVWLLPLMVRLTAPNTPRLGEVSIGLPVLAFTIAASALTVLVAGLVPAWHASRPSPSENLLAAASAGRHTARSGRLRFLLITAETALSTVVLIAALLFARSLGMLLSVEADRPIDHVLTLGLTLPWPQYEDMYRDPSGRARAMDFAKQAIDRVRRIPGVDSTAIATALPPNLSEMQFTGTAHNPATGKNEPYEVELPIVGGDYFRVMGVKCLRGRLFDARDTEGAARALIVNRDFARRMLGTEEVVGRQVPLFGNNTATIVGVVDDIRYGGLNKPSGGAMYLPYAQAATNSYYIVVRTTGSPASLAAQVRDAVHSIDPSVPLAQPRTLNELRHASVADPESRAMLLGMLGVLALTLAAVGLYGNSSYVTSQRSFEVGLRMALGADGKAVLRLLVGHGLVPVLLGLAIGIGSAAALSRVVSSLLFEVRPVDAFTFTAVPLLLLTVAAAAVTAPAFRASRIDPAVTLRRSA